MEDITVVDENDNAIGYKERGKIKPDDIYRVSALWIKNSRGDILLAKRALTKKNDPGKWGPSVAGTVGNGESYEENIVREAEEELGLKGIKPVKGPKVRTYGKHNFFCQWFILTIDKKISEFRIQKEEVDRVKWFSKEELIKMLESNPEYFLNDMKKYVELFKDE
ncbi:MAG: NUDIX domain-containing protein [Candidatus Aenigmarchaeota archaeon]|nr:NUDIX domain-containing protein [Candidatus Aenigmarchaeota archaeon]